ncbi:hypothetical protein BaRGS_00013881 [Batillaria attramentaria]|uniref:Uncharacterized protein n=1 Tax=Batillaria attramentaria TaxID=370345 RepID=A0ABD0L6S7_9CAEN
MCVHTASPGLCAVRCGPHSKLPQSHGILRKHTGQCRGSCPSSRQDLFQYSEDIQGAELTAVQPGNISVDAAIPNLRPDDMVSVKDASQSFSALVSANSPMLSTKL